jgi:hypothetical protein
MMAHRRADGRYERFTTDVPGGPGLFDTASANLTIGPSRVRQRAGVYTLQATARGEAGVATIDLTVQPVTDQYFPAVELGGESLVSGYAVPALAASATGTLCIADRCAHVRDVPAYHDHNWGVWQDVTWEWGTARGSRSSVLYGGIYQGDRTGTPLFLSLVDSLGFRQILRFSAIDYRGARHAAGLPGALAPAGFDLVASRLADTVRLEVDVVDALATVTNVGGMRRPFFQMRGTFRMAGKVEGKEISDTGTGFFETYVRH